MAGALPWHSLRPNHLNYAGFARPGRGEAVYRTKRPIPIGQGQRAIVVGFCVNLDYGSNDTIKFCTFTNGLFLVGGDHETFMKNTVTGPFGSTVFQSDGQANSFKLNTVASGNVQLTGSDVHQNNIVTLGVAAISGGKQQGSTP